MEKKAVIWVSTVLYILITLAVLSLAFAALKPKIDEMRDKAIIEQSIEMMNKIDETISQVQETQGTVRQVQINLKKGSLIFDSPSDKILWQFYTSYKYSELKKPIAIGNIKALTTEATNIYNITLTLQYTNDIRFDDKDEKKVITSAELPFNLFFENKKIDDSEYIDIYPLSG